MKDHFKNRAEIWDKGDTRVKGAQIIAKEIASKIDLTHNMRIMDFGVGTGLLGFELAQVVQEVVGVDTSANMLEKLQEKNTPELHIKSLCQDIIKNPLDDTFDAIVSSMTLHHIEIQV